MGKLISTVLPESVTPEWLARTYSEYLYACAEDQIDINNAIAEACDDDQLDTLINGYRDVWDDNIDAINNAISSFAIAKGCLQDDITNRTDKFKLIMQQWNPSTEVQLKASNIAGKYDDTWASGDAFLAAIINSSFDSDTYVLDQQDVSARINALGDQVNNVLHLPAGYSYPLQEGFFNFKDLVKSIIRFTASGSGDEEFELSGIDSQDDSIGTVKLISRDVIQQMKDTASSNIAWAQGFLSCTYDNISDRITNFAESVKTAFSSAYTEAKESFNNVRAILSSATCTVSNFIQQASDQLGWTDLIESNTIVGDTDVSSYTGASPYAGIDLHTAKGLATATAKTVVAAGYAVWQGMKKIGSKIWGKVRPFVKAITNDPEDFKVIDSDAESYQFDKWAYNCNGAEIRMRTSTSAEADTWYDIIHNKYLNKAFAFDNYFGSMMMEITDVYKSSNLNPGIYIHYAFKFKPKAINIDTAVSTHLMECSETSSGSGIYHLTNNTSYIQLQDPDAYEYYIVQLKDFVSSNKMYLDDDVSEEIMYQGVHSSVQCCFMLGFMQLAEFYGQSANWNGWSGKIDIMKNAGSTYTTYDFTDPSVWAQNFTKWHDYVSKDANGHIRKYGNATNLDFLKTASGYHENWEEYCMYDGTALSVPFDQTGQFQMWHSTNISLDITAKRGGLDINDMIGLFVSFFALQAHDRYFNPGDFLFIPYTTDTYEFGSARYDIKTDAENARIVDIFVSALVIVVAIAITVIIGAKIARTIKKAKFKKWTAIKGQLDNKIWTNGPLSKKEWRKYLRADRKLSKINLWSTGTAAANVVSSSGISDSISSIIDKSSDNVSTNSENYVDDVLNQIRLSIVGSL